MNSAVYEYFQKGLAGKGEFSDVVLLDDESFLSYEEVIKLVPDMPKGWYELSRLAIGDRVDFTAQYWQTILPFFPHINNFLSKFFDKIDDVAVFITKKEGHNFFSAELVYSMQNETTFFKGGIPLSDAEAVSLNSQFNNSLPRDYLAFLKIHNGFSKNLDFGLIKAQNIKLFSERMQTSLIEERRNILCGDKKIDPKSLIFFYQDYDFESFQCFNTDWFPLGEMGNVYFSMRDLTISNYNAYGQMEDKLAFYTFLDWLIFYLEEIEE
jgi:hypothetical protein